MLVLRLLERLPTTVRRGAAYPLMYGLPTAAGGIERPTRPTRAMSARMDGNIEIISEMFASRWSGIDSAKPKPNNSVAANAQPGSDLPKMTAGGRHNRARWSCSRRTNRQADGRECTGEGRQRATHE